MVKIEITKPELVWPLKFNGNGRIKNINRLNLPFQVIERINETQTTREAKINGAQKTLFDHWNILEENITDKSWRNKLIWGDNKIVMSSLLKMFAGKINLIYIDPPFATGTYFYFTSKIGDGDIEIPKKQSILEEKAYRDTWGNGLSSYLQMLFERLILMKELLAENGSIYVHLDYHVGHYVKLLLDEIFGYKNFRSEIVWNVGSISGFKSQRKGYVRQNDTILYYVKNNDNFIFNKQYLPYNTEYIEKMFRYIDKDGRRYRKRGERKQYLDESKGIPLGTVWNIISFQTATMSNEYINYPTQKPEKLLERIIISSSNPGDLIADFFSGSGTTLVVAEKLNRRWIGCDLGRFAIHLTRKRLIDIQNCKSFEILNLGKYERQVWQDVSFTGKDKQTILYEYLAFILKLYGAEPVSGFSHIHGKKGKSLIHIGSVNVPVTTDEIMLSVKETAKAGFRDLYVLGWEWEMGLHDLIEKEAIKEGVNLVLKMIPNEVMEEEAVRKGDLKFFDLARLKTKNIVNGKSVSIELIDFVIPNAELILPEIREKITKWSDYVDYWAVDFDFKNDIFVNRWTSYRTKQSRTLKLKSDPYTYKEKGTYKILVKVIDIFGIDTSQIFEVVIE